MLIVMAEKNKNKITSKAKQFCTNKVKYYWNNKHTYSCEWIDHDFS